MRNIVLGAALIVAGSICVGLAQGFADAIVWGPWLIYVPLVVHALVLRRRAKRAEAARRKSPGLDGVGT